MAAEDENSSQPDISAMLKGQTSACKAARDAIAARGEVTLFDGRPPQWMVFGIAATRLRWSLKIGLTTLGLDETVEILRALHRDEQLRTGNIVAVRIHTGVGRDTRTDLYQDRRAYVWNNDHDTATLRNACGRLVDEELWGHHRYHHGDVRR